MSHAAEAQRVADLWILPQAQPRAVARAKLRIGLHALVLVGAGVFPRQRLAARRIVRAPHAVLIAVEDHRRADVGRLDRHAQQRSLVHLVRRPPRLVRHVRRVFLARLFIAVLQPVVLVVAAAWVPEHVHVAVRVVAREEILVHQLRLRRIAGEGLFKPRGELRARDGRGLQNAIGIGPGPLQLGVVEPREDRVRERIVHLRIEDVRVSQALGLAPDLGDRNRLGVDAAHVLAPRLPEAVPHLTGNIEAPAIDAVARIAIAIGIHPSPGHIKDVLLRAGVEVPLLHRLVPVAPFAENLPELREIAVLSLPARPALKLAVAAKLSDEPGRVRRRLAALLEISEGPVLKAHVVPHAIEHDAQLARLRGGQELIHEVAIGLRPCPRRGILRLALRRAVVARVDRLARRRRVAQRLVDVAEVAGVVLVQASGLKDRVEIDRGDAKVRELAHLLLHALQIAAVAPVEDDFVQITTAALARVGVHRAAFLPRLQLARQHLVPVGGPRGHEDAAAVGVVRSNRVLESLWENLIPDGTLGPIGRLELGRDHEWKALGLEVRRSEVVRAADVGPELEARGPCGVVAARIAGHWHAPSVAILTDDDDINGSHIRRSRDAQVDEAKPSGDRRHMLGEARIVRQRGLARGGGGGRGRRRLLAGGHHLSSSEAGHARGRGEQDWERHAESVETSHLRRSVQMKSEEGVLRLALAALEFGEGTRRPRPFASTRTLVVRSTAGG